MQTYALSPATRSSSSHHLPEVDPRATGPTCHHAGVPNVASTLLSLALAGLLTLAAFTDRVARRRRRGGHPAADRVGPDAAVRRCRRGAALRDRRGRWSRGHRACRCGPRCSRAPTARQRRCSVTPTTGCLRRSCPRSSWACSSRWPPRCCVPMAVRNLVATTAVLRRPRVLAALTVGWIGAVKSFGDAEVVAVGAAGVAAGLLVWLAADRPLGVRLGRDGRGRCCRRRRRAERRHGHDLGAGRGARMRRLPCSRCSASCWVGRGPRATPTRPRPGASRGRCRSRLPLRSSTSRDS